jgi:hypothetical protein
VSAFVDATMLRLHAPDGVRDLLFPTGAGRLDRVRRLAVILHGLPAATVHDVLQVDLLTAEFQRPLFRPRLLGGTWTRTSPELSRTDVQYEGREAGAPPEWIDLALRVAATVVLELDGAEVESIRLADIGEFDTLAEFEAKFRHFDLAGFMARHAITTVDELKRAYRYLLGEIRLADPPPFDPADPANRRRLTLELAVLLRDTIDLTEGLRAARLVRDLVERGTAFRRQNDGLEVRAPVAPVLVFPAAAEPPEAELLAFYASQDVVAIPVPP